MSCYYDDVEYNYKECSECEEHTATIEEIKYWVKSIVDLVYSDDNFEDFETYLEELTHVLDMKIPQTSPNVCRKKSKENPILSDWIKFNREYNKKLLVNQ